MHICIYVFLYIYIYINKYCFYSKQLKDETTPSSRLGMLAVPFHRTISLCMYIYIMYINMYVYK